MTNRSTWTGSALDLLRAGADLPGPGLPSGIAAWPKNPRALAGRLRRAQPFLRALGIHIAFSREGRAGTRVIRIHTGPKIPSAPSASATMITISGLTNGRRGQSVQPETTAIDPGSGRPTKLTVLTQRLPCILGNLRVLKLASPCASRARAQFCQFQQRGRALVFQIKSGGYPKVSDPTERQY